MLFGACYYLEHWPEERWTIDAKLMQKAGFNAVRMAEFAWSRIEPQDGSFDLSWLDRCIDLLYRHGIHTILGTPTAGAPKWLMDQHPDAYKVDMDGHVRGFGSRMHACLNHAGFIQHVERLVQYMAKHYSDHPAVIGWQVDNELGVGNTALCYCENCQASFGQWLKEKYKTIERLNEEWGTNVWSHTYPSFESVVVPRRSVTPLHNPSLQLDFRRFSSDTLCRFQKLQRDILKQVSPNQVVTHNMMGAFSPVNYYDLAEHMDIASLDIYPNLPDDGEVEPMKPALHHDVTRCLKGENYWVLEHQSGTPGGRIMLTTPKPGDLRRWTYQSVARGASAIIYFRWRHAISGAEEFWHGILPHSGKLGRVYDEVTQTGKELAQLSDLLEGSKVMSQAAIIRCYDNDWTFNIQPQMPGFHYAKHLRHYYRALFHQHIPVDIISPEADFSAYRLLIFPSFAMSEATVRHRIEQFVEAGGIAVFDFRAGTKEKNNKMLPEVIPGPLHKLLGISIEDYGIIPEDESITISYEDKVIANGKGHWWYDVISTDGAETVARFNEDYYAGNPAVTRNRIGSGEAWYIGTELDDAGMQAIVKKLVAVSELYIPLPQAPQGLEIVPRFKNGQVYLFVINHTRNRIELPLDDSYTDVITGRSLSDRITLTSNEILLLTKIGEKFERSGDDV